MAFIGTRLVLLAALGLAAGLAASSAAASGAKPVAPVNAEHGVAIKGYDPVAYFTSGRAMPGRPEYTTVHGGATYWFASADNRDRFAANPAAYAPQYGGYCAYAMSIDRIADIDPARWAIVGGRLYLNNNRLVHALWSVNPGGHIDSADQHWAAWPKAPQAEAR